MSALFRGIPLFSKETAGGSGIPDGGGVSLLLPNGAVMAYDFSDVVCYAAYAALAIQNVIASPADGEAQAAYDGLISEGTNFQNTLGKANGYLLKGSAAEHPEVSTKTAWTNLMHQADADWTLNLQFRTYVNTDVSNVLFSTSGGIDNMSRKGIAIFRTTSTNIQFQVQNGSGSAYALNEAFTITAMPANTDISMTFAMDEAAGTLDLWINGAKYSKTGLSFTSPFAGASGYDPKFGYGSGSDGLETGSRWYSALLMNNAVADAGELNIRKSWEAVHNRSYTA